MKIARNLYQDPQEKFNSVPNPTGSLDVCVECSYSSGFKPIIFILSQCVITYLSQLSCGYGGGLKLVQVKVQNGHV